MSHIGVSVPREAPDRRCCHCAGSRFGLLTGPVMGGAVKTVIAATELPAASEVKMLDMSRFDLHAVPLYRANCRSCVVWVCEALCPKGGAVGCWG